MYVCMYALTVPSRALSSRLSDVDIFLSPAMETYQYRTYIHTYIHTYIYIITWNSVQRRIYILCNVCMMMKYQPSSFIPRVGTPMMEIQK